MYTPASLILPVLFCLSIPSCTAKSIPANIAALKSSIIAKGNCAKPLKTGFSSRDGGPDTWSYCGDHLDQGIIYVSGPNGKLVNIDIDCDGKQHGDGDDGRCGSSSDTQSQTSFMDTVAGYQKGIKDLNAYVHPYVVFGNVGSKPGYAVFDPEKNGVKALSLMVVVCGDQMFYGIFGDTNGDDGNKAMVGEASISMATLCFGKKMNGNAGYDQDDVLVLAFTGADAVPGADRANWAAKTVEEFIAYKPFDDLGDSLVAKIGGGATGGGGGEASKTIADARIGLAGAENEKLPTTLATSVKLPVETGTSETPTEGEGAMTEKSCAWPGHCVGAQCENSGECSGELICKAKVCSSE